MASAALLPPNLGAHTTAPASTMIPNDYSKGFHFVVKYKGKPIADLVGSLHEDDKEICRLNPTVEEAAKKAKRIAFESLITAKDLDRIQAHRRLSKSTNQQSYHEYNDTHQQHSRIRYKPLFSTSPKEKISREQSKGTEHLILKLRGVGSESEIIPLETVEEHAEALNIYELMTETLNQKYSEKVILMGDYSQAENDTITAYQNGDEQIIYALSAVTKSLDPSGHYHLITKRNHIHAREAKLLIKQATPDEKVLIAIGTDHLFGEEGVIKLLQKDLGPDYSIERVRG